MRWAISLPKGGPRCLTLTWSNVARTLRIAIPGRRVGQAGRKFLRDKVRWMFRADEDFAEFWTLCRSHPALRHCASTKRGALLRSPSVFEDVVKTLCTINCHWRNTERMVANLCQWFGEPCPGDGQVYTFPTPHRLAAASDRELQQVRLGFRAAWVRQFARRVVDGELDLDAWSRQQDPEALRAAVLGVQGIGSYAANHMLMLLGHYEAIPCDSAVRAYLGISPKASQRELERRAAKRYARWGKYAYLAYMFERVFLKRNDVDCQPPA